jgi:hypothetical protein
MLTLARLVRYLLRRWGSVVQQPRCACSGKHNDQCYFSAYFAYQRVPLAATPKQEQEKSASPSRSPSRDRGFFATITPYVTELMDEGMDQHRLP